MRITLDKENTDNCGLFAQCARTLTLTLTYETWSDAQLASNVAVAKRKLRWKLLCTFAHFHDVGVKTDGRSQHKHV